MAVTRDTAQKLPAASPARKFRVSVGSTPQGAGPGIARAGVAALLTVVLLVFLAVMRLEFSSKSPTLTMRSFDRLDAVSLPAPPPPPPPDIPPPPPPKTQLPKLDLQIDPVAPPVKANIDQDVDFDLTLSEFAPQNEQPRQDMVFSLSDVDNKPKLLNRPTFTFPNSLKRQGVSKGVVKLEIRLSPRGQVDIKRIISATHQELIPVAKTFASRARFTPVEKDGRAVNLSFIWPIQFEH